MASGNGAGRTFEPDHEDVALAQWVYYTLIALDRHVVVRYVGSPSFLRRGSGRSVPVVRLPREYTRWADKATEEDIDQFWEYVLTGQWRKAKKLSGLPHSVIAELMAAAAEESRFVGAYREEAYIPRLGIKLSTLLYLIRVEAGERRAKLIDKYINRKHAPVFAALPNKVKEAFIWLARAIRESSK